MKNHEPIKQKILEHLNQLNEYERKTDARALIKKISKQYDTPEPVVEKVIADWEAGDKKEG